MPFTLYPILADMRALYNQPRTPERFQAYIKQLQGGTRGDLALPIGGFNPMAKDHILTKIGELEDLSAEQIMQEALDHMNQHHPVKEEFTVVLNLADDLKGGWTNHFTTDFDSKFKLQALVARHFCTPYCWTSEDYSAQLIEQRTLEQCHRTRYWLDHGKPVTLADHLAQEVHVATQLGGTVNGSFEHLEHHFAQHQSSMEYDLIFNFFYGDAASEGLGFRTFGVEGATGFDLARKMATQKK